MLVSKPNLEKDFIQHLSAGRTNDAEKLLTSNKGVIKLLGAKIWDYALKLSEPTEAINLLIKHKAPVYLPKAGSMRVTIKLDYTFTLAITYKSKALLHHLTEHYIIHQTILDYGVIILCNMPEFDEQLNMIDLILKLGANPSAKNHRAMYNATLIKNGKIISTLIYNGSYLINKECAELFLRETKKEPYDYLMECEDERSHSAIMSCIANDDSAINPLDHFEK